VESDFIALRTSSAISGLTFFTILYPSATRGDGGEGYHMENSLMVAASFLAMVVSILLLLGPASWKESEHAQFLLVLVGLS
jgi:hypothetical protein